MNNQLKLGWLSPQGDFVECGCYDHIAVARELVDKYNYNNNLHLAVDDLLLKNGWVHISMMLLGKKEWAIFWEGFLTQQQINFLKPYYEESDIPPCLGSLYNWEKEFWDDNENN